MRLERVLNNRRIDIPTSKKLVLDYIEARKDKPHTLAFSEGDIPPRYLLTIDEELEPIERKYGRVTFLRLVDRHIDTPTRLILKQNNGVVGSEYDEGSSTLGDASKVTEIEADALERTRKKFGDSITECFGHSQDLLLLGFVDGQTYHKFLTERGGVLTYMEMLQMVDSLLQIDFELTDMISGNQSHAKFLSGRRARALQHDLSQAGIDHSSSDLSENFFPLRIAAAAKIHDWQPFAQKYGPISRILDNAPKVWISFDHPANRIIAGYGDTGPFPNTRYDFNHLSFDTIGLDLVMQLGAIRSFPESDESATMARYVNIADYVLLKEFVYSSRQPWWNPDLVSSATKPAERKITELSDPEQACAEVIDISDLYPDHHIIHRVAAMHGAFVHRTILDAFRLANDPINDNKQQATALYDSIEHICAMTRKFYGGLTEPQKKYLDQQGFTPVNYADLDTYIRPCLDRALGQ